MDEKKIRSQTQPPRRFFHLVPGWMMGAQPAPTHRPSHVLNDKVPENLNEGQYT
jgi:hypothetical protein